MAPGHTIYMLVLPMWVLLIGCRGQATGDRSLPGGRAVLDIQGRSVELPEDSELVRLVRQYAKQNRLVGPALVTRVPVFNLRGTPDGDAPWRAELLPGGRMDVHDDRGPSPVSWSLAVQHDQVCELRRMALKLREAESATKPVGP
jgi:hypothetical protein